VPAQPTDIAAVEDEQPKEPPMADPGTTLELMTKEQQQAFLLKQHAQTLIRDGHISAKEALDRHLISEADAAQLRLVDEQTIKLPLAVLEAPPEQPIPMATKCC
jgi:hypothetical protein